MTETEALYTKLGGRFVTPIDEMKARLKGIKAFIFDWDGVFNSGQKSANVSSNFNEVDSMGTNLMRYAYYLTHGAQPITAIISGERNETAFYFCERESFMYSFFKVPSKKEALDFICKREKIDPKNIAYFFDDVLDIPIAEACGLRVQVNQKANPLFVDYCVKHGLVDYLTANSGGQYAIREASELLISLYGNYDTVIANRAKYNESYTKYLTSKKQASPEFFTLKENGIEQT